MMKTIAGGKKVNIPRFITSLSAVVYQEPMSQHRTSYQQCVHFQMQIGFKDTSRKTILKGHNKLACRAIVMKQYKTAVNHLMEIETVKKDVADTLKKPHLIEKNILITSAFTPLLSK